MKDANTMTLTNDEGLSYPISFSYTNAATVFDWPGYGPNILPNPSSFICAPLVQGEVRCAHVDLYLQQQLPFCGTSTVIFCDQQTDAALEPAGFKPPAGRHAGIQRGGWSSHVIDYVQLIGPENSVDLTAAITNLYDTYYDRNNYYQKTVNNGYNDMWDPIVNNGWPVGIAKQFEVSVLSYPIILSPYWSQSNPVDVTNQITAFRAFLGLGGQSGELSMQAPYTPTATVACLTLWEVNDPLVHYLASDLAGSDLTNPPVPQMTPLTFGVLNDRYLPWGGKPQFSPTAGDASFEFQNRFNRAIKDPLVSSSDYWDFPANKFPTTGWLGRVHRGTPWQTVYLKSADVLATGGIIPWMSWTGNPNPFDAVNDAPVQDRLLFDLFTTAFNDNATRGTLSVNQAAGSADPDAGLAAWSAVFSGLVVAGPTNSYTVIAPAGTNVPNSALGILVSNINYTRANFQSADGLAGVFEHEGDILSVPQLSDLIAVPEPRPDQLQQRRDV